MFDGLCIEKRRASFTSIKKSFCFLYVLKNKIDFKMRLIIHYLDIFIMLISNTMPFEKVHLNDHYTAFELQLLSYIKIATTFFLRWIIYLTMHVVATVALVAIGASTNSIIPYAFFSWSQKTKSFQWNSICGKPAENFTSDGSTHRQKGKYEKTQSEPHFDLKLIFLAMRVAYQYAVEIWTDQNHFIIRYLKSINKT